MPGVVTEPGCSGGATLKIRKSSAMLIAALVILVVAAPMLAASSAPRLVLQITVDQLRGDLPARYADRLTE
jgi:hypothetical protein